MFGRLSPGRKLGIALVPWVPLGAIAAVYMLVLVPRVQEGRLVAVCMGAFAGLVFFVFVVAAVTFSADVLRDRWPARE